MTYSDHDIKNALRCGAIAMAPFDTAAIQPASVDLRLGGSFFRFRHHLTLSNRFIDPHENVKDLMVHEYNDSPMIMPGELLLGVTMEHITLCNYVVARIEGKSSLGRLGLSVHVTAGFIDPGFSGHITLEMYNCAPFPIKLRAGMWIAQLAFSETATPCDVPYGVARGSRYTDQHACEPVVSRVHEKVS